MYKGQIRVYGIYHNKQVMIERSFLIYGYIFSFVNNSTILHERNNVKTMMDIHCLNDISASLLDCTKIAETRILKKLKIVKNPNWRETTS